MPRVLLVDDDDALRKMLASTLADAGHVVIEARHGKEALELQDRERGDLILTDLIMPEMEGMETIKELRRIYPTVKIIAMSGGGRVSAVDYLAIAKALGADRILAKPFSNKAMVDAIAEVLRTP